MRKIKIQPTTASGTLLIPLGARLVLSLLLSVMLIWMDIPGAAFAQEDRSLWDSVVDGNAAPKRDYLNDVLEFDASILDSLRLRALRIEIEQSHLQVSETNLLHRLMPQIHLSTTFGIRDIVFIDPSNTVPYVLPKDAYRLSISLSLSEVFDFSKHRAAELRLDRLEIDYARIQQQQVESRSKAQREFSELIGLLALLADEVKMKEDVLKFNDLRFQQGKIEYDALIRSKLDVLNVKKTIHQLTQQIDEIRFKLHGGVQR